MISPQRQRRATGFEPFVIWSCIWGPLGDNLVRAGIPVRRLPLNEARRLPEAVAGIADIQPDIFHSFSYRKDDRDVRAAKEAGVGTIFTSRGDLRFWDEAQTLKEWEPFRNNGTGMWYHRLQLEAIAEVVRKRGGRTGGEDSRHLQRRGNSRYRSHRAPRYGMNSASRQTCQLIGLCKGTTARKKGIRICWRRTAACWR